MQPSPDYPGYGPPQPQQQPDYGTPQSPYPAYPQPSQQPYPGYAPPPAQPAYPGYPPQPSQQPYPGYGAPAPSQQPYPGYGAPAQQPYPGYGAGYGPAQQAYPGYSAPSQQPYGYGAPPPSPPKTGMSRSTINGLVAGGVVLLLIILAVVHYNGPTGTVQGYYNDLFISGNASDAYGRLCADAQAQTSVSKIQAGINALKTGGTSYDISGLTYSTVDENFFGIAHVRLGGSFTVTLAGKTQTLPVTSSNANPDLILQSSGLGWCLTEANFKTTTSDTSAAPGWLARP